MLTLADVDPRPLTLVPRPLDPNFCCFGPVAGSRPSPASTRTRKLFSRQETLATLRRQLLPLTPSTNNRLSSRRRPLPPIERSDDPPDEVPAKSSPLIPPSRTTSRARAQTTIAHSAPHRIASPRDRPNRSPTRDAGESHDDSAVSSFSIPTPRLVPPTRAHPVGIRRRSGNRRYQLHDGRRPNRERRCALPRPCRRIRRLPRRGGAHRVTLYVSRCPHYLGAIVPSERNGY